MEEVNEISTEHILHVATTVAIETASFQKLCWSQAGAPDNRTALQLDGIPCRQEKPASPLQSQYSLILVIYWFSPI